ncbi:MAG: hypothetical protein RPR97_11660 [Colwellia sp.]|jgi:hypothetical protein
MDKITINNAAELFGKSRRTIQRYISSGGLSFDDLNDGTKLLDVEELELLFGKLSPAVISQLSPNVTSSDNTQQLDLISEGNSLAKQQLEASKQTNALLSELISLIREQPLPELEKVLSINPRPKKASKVKWHTPKGVFDSGKEAAEAHGINRRTMSDWFNKDSIEYKGYYKVSG